MKTIEINLYSFDELSETAKQKVLSNMFDINTFYGWWDNIYEDAENIGLKIEGFDLDRNKHCTGYLKSSACETAQDILNQHGESCDTYTIAERFLNEWQPIFNDYMNENSENYESIELGNKLSDLESEFKDRLLEEYASILENEYEYLSSDKAIIETIEANDYYFTENGKLA